MNVSCSLCVQNFQDSNYVVLVAENACLSLPAMDQI